MNKIFRFDDICINTDMDKANAMGRLFRRTFPNCEIWFCIAPLVHDMRGATGSTAERLFPKILNAYSDFRRFYEVGSCGLPEIIPEVSRASHGLIHVDHRLLTKEVQELSILASCSLAKSKIFVPPFNKWNRDTEDICREHGIRLVKFEDGWLCVEYNDFNLDHDLWYLHSRRLTVDDLKNWIECGNVDQEVSRVSGTRGGPSEVTEASLSH